VIDGSTGLDQERNGIEMAVESSLMKSRVTTPLRDKMKR
jgi:hypothetical protein